MFTGIVGEVGEISRIEQRGENRRITVTAEHAPKELKTGDSVAVSGVCLTALDINPGSFCADLAPETWERTSFSRIHEGALVNLELPMKADGRFGGHIVQGHVDGVGKLIEFERIAESENWWLHIELPDRGREVYSIQGIDFDRGHQPDGGEVGKKPMHDRDHSSYRRDDKSGLTEARRSGEPRSRPHREIRRENDDARVRAVFTVH